MGQYLLTTKTVNCHSNWNYLHLQDQEMVLINWLCSEIRLLRLRTKLVFVGCQREEKQWHITIVLQMLASLFMNSKTQGGTDSFPVRMGDIWVSQCNNDLRIRVSLPKILAQDTKFSPIFCLLFSRGGQWSMKSLGSHRTVLFLASDAQGFLITLHRKFPEGTHRGYRVGKIGFPSKRIVSFFPA